MWAAPSWSLKAPLEKRGNPESTHIIPVSWWACPWWACPWRACPWWACSLWACSDRLITASLPRHWSLCTFDLEYNFPIVNCFSQVFVTRTKHTDCDRNLAVVKFFQKRDTMGKILIFTYLTHMWRPEDSFGIRGGYQAWQQAHCYHWAILLPPKHFFKILNIQLLCPFVPYKLSFYGRIVRILSTQTFCKTLLHWTNCLSMQYWSWHAQKQPIRKWSISFTLLACSLVPCLLFRMSITGEETDNVLSRHLAPGSTYWLFQWLFGLCDLKTRQSNLGKKSLSWLIV